MTLLSNERHLFREYKGREAFDYYDEGSPKRIRGGEEGGITGVLRSVFLPRDYPGSVSSDYMEYQLWDTAQAFSSSLNQSFATRAVLKGFGVGDENATPLAATITWLSRHGAGMIGQILFAHYKAPELDSDPKKWRLFADVLNDIAMASEIAASYMPSYVFSTMACVASVLRSLVGVAGGATRTAVVQHQARANNISDVAAKDGSQETLVNLLGLIINISFLPLIPDNPFTIWLSFFFLTLFHLFANYKSVKSLVFDNLNRERLSIILKTYKTRKRIPSVKEVNLEESVICSKEKKNCSGYEIIIGVSSEHFVEEIMKNKEKLRNKKFLLLKDSPSKIIRVILTTKDVNLVEVYFEAYKMISPEVELGSFEEFSKSLRTMGWTTDRAQILTSGWKVQI